jgi:multiple sugar transport system substrate-binding protein
MKRTLGIVCLLLILLVTPVFAGGEKEASGTTKISLWHRWSGDNEKFLQQTVDAFTAKNPDIEIEVVTKAGEYMELLQSMIADMAAGNTPPDIFVGGYNLLEYIATELKPNDLKDMAPNAAAYDELKSRFEPAVFDITNVDGKQVGSPFALSNIIMYVNMDIFKAAGLSENDVPKTWDDMFRVGKIIKERTGKYMVGIQLPDTWADAALIYSAGGTLKTDDGKYVDFSNAGIIEALGMWQRLYNEKLIPMATDPELQADFSAGNIAMLGTTIMKINGIKSETRFDLRTAQFPSFTGHPKMLPAGGAALISFSKPKAQREAVWKFIDFCASQEGMEIFTQTGYLGVTKHEVPKTVYQQPAYDQQQYAFTWPCWPGGAAGLEIERLYLNARNRIIMENRPVARTLADLEKESNALID